jgi:hypothetical protein
VGSKTNRMLQKIIWKKPVLNCLLLLVEMEDNKRNMPFIKLNSKDIQKIKGVDEYIEIS